MSLVHPLLVHFPIAFLTIGFFFDLSGIMRSRYSLNSVGWWMQLLGTVAIFFSIASGLLAKESVEIHGASVAVLETHQEMAFVSTTLFSVLFLWRIAMRKAIPEHLRWLFFLCYGSGVVVLWTGAWFGGVLVYKYGIGVFGPSG